MTNRAASVQLRALPVVDRPRPAAFCGHCGARPAHATESDAASRVCRACELGLLLEADPELAPGQGDPFLVINGSLVVCAMSAGAEELLGIEELEAVNRHIGEFLMPADAEARAPDNLIAAILAAAVSDSGPHTVVARPSNEFGVRLWVRIGPCGPPRAALLVLNASRA